MYNTLSIIYGIFMGKKLKITKLLIGSLIFGAIATSIIISESHAREAEVRVLIEPTISLKLTKSKIKLSAMPVPTGTFVSDSLKVQVTTNSVSGYTLSMSAEGEETALKHTKASSSEKINSLSSDVAKIDFPLNQWGFSLDNNSYKSIPPLSTPQVIKNSSTSAVDDETEVSFASKIGPGLDAGNYKNSVVFSAIANADSYAEPLSQIEYLQEMTPGVCAATTTPRQGATTTTTEHTTDDNFVPEKDLIDSRDNRVYKVRKFADGNCWMTQNLALRLDTGTALTPGNTDVLQNFTPEFSTQNSDQLGISWGAQEVRSYEHSDAYTGPRYGIFYSWKAAVAGSEVNSFPSDANQSICPKGWKLPNYGVQEKSFEGLTAAGITSSSPLFASTNAGGYSDDGSLYRVGSDYDRYWTTKASSNYQAYSSLDTSSGNYYQYNFGVQIRCVAR